MKKYIFTINNLDCANCARELEEFLNKQDNLFDVKINFNTKKLTLFSEEEITKNYLDSLVKKVESDAYVSLKEEETNNNKMIILLVSGLFVGILANFINFSGLLKKILFLISYGLLLYKPFTSALKTFFKSKTINENALITISCTGAFIIGEYLEGMMVIVLYLIGKILEAKALNNTRNSVKELVAFKQNYANKKVGNDTIKINVEDCQVGDILIVKKGESVPVDGVLKDSQALLDESSLTGESLLVKKKKGDVILSGTVNKGEVFLIKATKTYHDSMAYQILELLENATDKKSNVETLVTKISKVYTPLVLLLAIVVAIILPIGFKIPIKDSFYRALTFLVISCPCAIAISVPLSYFTSIGASSKKGILIKGSNYLDNLSNIKNIIFDKTGTLTNGNYAVTDIDIIDKKYKKEEIVTILKKGESFSNHPIASSIMALPGKKVSTDDVKNFKELEGVGISYTIGKDKITIGNDSFDLCKVKTNLHLHINNKHVASITLSDSIKANAKDTISLLNKNNIKTYMFTGDKKEIALKVSNDLGIDKTYYELLPTDKFSYYDKVKKNDELTAFVGDGINDAPVLKRSDVGISMGALGSSAAILASDIVLMNDDISNIWLAIKISKYTNGVIKENLIFALLTKSVILLLSVFGLANMWLAVFADTGVTLLTILNSMKILRRFNKNDR